MRLLVVEDDNYLAQSLNMALEEQGYLTEIASDGQQAVLALANNSYDLVVLDLNLPYLDGMEVLKRFRAKGQSTPILILSARDGLPDRVAGLDCGANDYLVKPFELAEFEARVRALLRKEHWSNLLEIKCGNLTFNTNTKQAFIAGERTELTARELALLEALLSQLGKLVTKRDLLKRLVDLDLELTMNALDIVMHRLRKKISKATCEIKTMRGVGYTISDMEITA
jgi:two-component system, OmpR family, response regulator